MTSLPKHSFEPPAREQQPVDAVSALPSAASPSSTASPPSAASPRNSASLPLRRSHLGFLRRSRSGDPVRMPVVAPSPPPKLPDLPVNAASPTDFPAHLLRDDERTSVDILTGTLDEPARNGVHKSTDLHAALGGFVPGRKSSDSVIGPSGEYLKSSPLSITEDPYANVGSMAHRGRYSYASSAVSTLNSPRRVRRRKDPTPFNILVIGARNCGKTSFLKFLRQSLALKSKRGLSVEDQNQYDPPARSAGAFKSTYLETEIDGERVGLTLWDSAGFERNVVDLQLRETVAFIEAKFEETFSEETKVIRAPGVRDTHIHCVFLLLDPARLTPNNHYVGKIASKHEPGGLDSDLDLSVLKALHGKTVVVPVISKADTCTAKHMEHLKGIVRKGLAAANEDPLESLELEIDNDEDDDDDESLTSTPKDVRQDSANEGLELTEDGDTFEAASASHSPRGHGTRVGRSSGSPSNGAITPGLSFIPLSVISPDSYEPDEPIGRRFPWGFADPYNEQHCDFVRLQYNVFSEWRAELREKSRENWYENWRSDRLGSSGRGSRRF